MRRLVIFSSFIFVCLFLQTHLFEARSAQTNSVVNVCAANYLPDTVSIDSIVAAFGTKLATTTAIATPADPSKPRVELPTMLGGTTVRVAGMLAPLFFVSPEQVNYVVPPGLQLSQLDSNGFANVEVTASNGVVSTGRVKINRVAPAIYSFDSSGAGLPAALIIRVRSDNNQILEPIAELSNGIVRANPVDLSRPDERIFLTMFVSGIRNATDPNKDGNVNENIRVLLNGFEVVPSYAGAQPTLAALDQINVEVPREFLGQRELRVVIKSLETDTTAETLVILAVPAITGVNWMASGLSDRSITSLATGNAIVVAGSTSGIFRSENNGANWTEVNYSNFSAPRILTLFYAGGTEFYAGGERSGPLFSADNGRKWGVDAEGFFIQGRTIYAYENYGGLIHAGTDLTLFRRGGSDAIGAPIKGWLIRPFIGDSTAVTALTHTFNRALLGTEGRGVFLGNRLGQSFSPSNQGLPVNAQVRAMTVSEQYVFVALNDGGLYRSTDHGATWSVVTNGLPANAAVKALHSYGRNIFAGVVGNGIFLSTDYGQSWRAANEGLTTLNVQAILATDTKLFAGTSNGVFASASLSPSPLLPLAIPQNVSTAIDTPKEILLGRADPQLSYSVVTQPQHGNLSGTLPKITYTPLAGIVGTDFFTFKVSNGKLTSPTARVEITINPMNTPPKIEIKGKTNVVVGEVVYLEIMSPDNEDGFAKITTSTLPAGAFFTQGVSTIDPSRFRWTANAAGVYQITLTATDNDPIPLSTTKTLTINVGENTEKGVWSSTNLPSMRFLHSLFADASGVYVGGDIAEKFNDPPKGVLLRSVDNGASWTPFNNGLPPLTIARRIAGNDDFLYIATSEGVWRSPKTTANWVKLKNGLQDLPASNIAISGNKVVVSSPLFLSLDRGETWNPIFRNASQITFSGNALFVNQFTLLGGTNGIRDDGIFFTTDDGKTWKETTNGLQNFKYFNHLQGNERAIFALTKGIDGFGRLFRSTDQGGSWQRLDPGVPGEALFSTIAATGDTIFLGTTPYGVYVSRDGGATWRPANLGLPQLTSITGMAVRGDSLFVSTFSHKAFVRKLANE